MKLLKKAPKPKDEAIAIVNEKNTSGLLSKLSQTKWLAVFCFFLSVGLYVNTLTHEFTYDDIVAVVQNPVVSGDVGIGEIVLRDFWGTPTKSSLSHKSYRPITSTLFRILWKIRGGRDRPLIFHLVLILANALVASLVVTVVLADCDPLQKVIVAILYTVHPIKTEAVAGIVGMAEVLAGLFVLLAFYMTKRKFNPMLVGIVCLLAGLSKETGVLGSLIIFVYCFQRKRTLYGVVCVVTSLFLFLFVRYLAFGYDWVKKREQIDIYYFF